MPRLSEARYHFLFEKAPLGFFVSDSQGRILDANSAFRTLFRLGKGAGRITGPELKKSGLASNFRLCLSRREPVISEAEVAHGKNRIYVQYYLTPFFDAAGKPEGVQGVVVNETAKKEAQNEWARIYDYVTELVSHLSPLVTLDRQFKIQFANRSFLDAFGFDSRAQVRRRKLQEVLQLSAPATRSLLEGLRKSENEPVQNAEFARESRIYGYSVFRFGDSTGLILRDITETRLLQQRVANLSAALLQLQETERQRIAKDLHDSVGQLILAAKINLISYKNDPGKFAGQFEAALDIIDRASQELREIYTNLYPSTLRDLGLVTTIRWYARNILEVRGLQVDLKLRLKHGLGHDAEVNLFRIIQETFSNIVKHSHAKRVQVILSDARNVLRLTIKDNGRGFVQNKPGGGFGLENIRQRIKHLGGQVVIETSPGAGTMYTITLPVGGKAA